MTLRDPDIDRIRWHCRRGMLEIDLVLNAFLEQHLRTLSEREIDAFRALLERPDPQLLDFIMGAAEPEGDDEREIAARLRAVKPAAQSFRTLTRGPFTLTPDLSPEGREEVRASLLPPGEGSGMRDGAGEIRGATG